jgi:hypothetical protein
MSNRREFITLLQRCSSYVAARGGAHLNREVNF